MTIAERWQSLLETKEKGSQISQRKVRLFGKNTDAWKD